MATIQYSTVQYTLPKARLPKARLMLAICLRLGSCFLSEARRHGSVGSEATAQLACE